MFDVNEFIVTALKSFFDRDSSSFIMGMTYGIKSTLDTTTYNAIKASGLSHLIVFSGSNIVIIFSIFYNSLNFLQQKMRIMVAGVILASFISLLPKEPSITRAFIMWGFVISGQLLNKKTSSVYTLMLTVIIMTLYDPGIVGNISFQLSVAAILGIMIFNKRQNENVESEGGGFVQNLRDDVMVTTSAQVFTIPLIYFYFGSFNPLSTIANILVSPITRPIIYLGLMTPLIYGIGIQKIYIVTLLGNALGRIFLFVVNIFSKYQV